MGAVEFEPWPKIARLNRDIVVTEKIDGTNAAVLIVPLAELDHIRHEDGTIILFDPDARNVTWYNDEFAVFAQSRKRFITPGNDNFAFAAWVGANAEALVATLGPGRHFGEWWGYGIQSGYGLPKGDRRFYLFNRSRWNTVNTWDVKDLGVVPILYEGPFDQQAINEVLADLRVHGSVAASGFTRPEGVVVYHTAANTSFKITLEGDEKPKGPEGHAGDYGN